MRLNKPRLRNSLIACLFILTTSCAKNEEKIIEKVTIGYLPMVSSLAYFVATENGYFSSRGLEVNSKTISKSDDMALDLMKGEIDLAIELSITPLLKNELLTASNIPFKIFSTSKITRENGFDGILVRGDSSISGIADLTAKKVAVFPGTTATNTFSAVFGQQYPKQKLPEFVNTIPLPQQLNALAKGEVDAVHAYEPALTIGILKFKFKKLHGSLYADQLSPNPIGVAAVNQAFVNNRPDVAKRAIAALDEANKYIRDNPAHARRILEQYTKAEKDLADNMNIMPMSQHSEIDSENLENYLQILKDINENKTTLNAKDLILKEL